MPGPTADVSNNYISSRGRPDIEMALGYEHPIIVGILVEYHLGDRKMKKIVLSAIKNNRRLRQRYLKVLGALGSNFAPHKYPEANEQHRLWGRVGLGL
jgi:hypothetical protein